MKIQKEAFVDKFESAFQYAAIGMAIVAPDGTWLKANNSLCKILGYTENELKKIDFQTVTHPDFLDVDMNFVKEMLNRKRDYYEMEKIYIHKNGNHVWALLSVSLVLDHDGSPKYFISQIQDITKRKVAENELQKINDDLSQSNQQLEEYAHMVSHDLKEPLRAASYYAEFLLEDYQDILPKEGRDLICKQKIVLHRMRELLDKVLTLSKVGQQEMFFERVDMMRLVSELISADLKVLIMEQNVDVQIDYLPNDVKCNLQRISEVFSNLIINGIKYNNSSNKIIRIGFDKKKNHYYVEDNGVGIDKIHKKDVYQIFRRVHAEDAFSSGSGVGLAIVKKIIERHNGKVWFESSKKLPGTKFCFSLNEKD